MSPLRPDTRHQLDLIARRAQSTGRVPGLLAAVAHSGSLSWVGAAGRAHLRREDPLDSHTPFPIASNTKMFVAAVIMALRDQGRLRLEDTLEEHVPGTAHGSLTIRSMLSHVSGLQREAPGGVWESLAFPDREALLADLGDAERIGPAHTRWHYSNLCFALLGEIITRLDGGDWFASVQRRILDPLGMRETGNGAPPAAVGRDLAGAYHVPPWSDVPDEEPPVDLGATAPAGSMVSTVADLARWGGFLADPDAAVLHPDSVEEMCTPVALASGFAMGYGLGVIVVPRGERQWVGHTGGMPGAVTGVFTDRASGVSVVAFMNSSQAPSPAALALDLGEKLLASEPPLPPVWTPGESVPPEFASLLGVWFSEGRRFEFSVRQGRLEARGERDTVASRFVEVSSDTHRAVEGPERGELLRLHRDENGVVARMTWAGYPFTREPVPFSHP
ncbi:MAG: serine hydrolase domain-containing protein [Mobilicoccus sp.]|nr:serine hydrolase domain-containing protein [Mobilicoccus sp.]